MSNFLDVPLTPNPKISDFVRLDGPRSLGSKYLYSLSGLRQGYIARFVKKSSRHSSDFLSAVKLQMLPHAKSKDCQKPDTSRNLDTGILEFVNSENKKLQNLC